jgi:hypothetical protein
MSIRLPRPTGIRNGGLLLVLVALAAVMALVDRPPEPGGGAERRLPGVFQTLPPPVGITQLPPPAAEPLTAGERPTAQARADAGAPATAVARRHPLRAHPRPADRARPALDRPVDRARPAPAGGGGRDGSGTTTRPPVAPPPVAGRDLPQAEVRTPEVAVEATTVQGARLRLG